MANPSELKQYELFCVVVNFGMADKVSKIAKRNGITGCTVFLGKGCVRNHFLEILEIADIRKEIVLMCAEKHLAEQTLTVLDKKIKFAKPHHGIAFSLAVESLLGTRFGSRRNANESGGAKDPMHKAIFVIVDKGNAEAIVDTAKRAGARGATIINARGSGIHENQVLFSMAIEPEKEIVMLIAKQELVDSIVAAIQDELKIDEPGNGIMFVLDVDQTYGLR